MFLLKNKKNTHQYIKVLSLKSNKKQLLCIDVLQLILEFVEDIKTTLNLCILSKECYEYLKIKELYSIKLTQKIIEQKKFNKLQILDACYNKYITNINHLTNTLVVLDCSSCSYGINQEGISNLKKLKILNVSYNPHITNIDHLADTLVELECKGDTCGINQKSISKLKKLKVLKAGDNKKITNVNHLADTLIELECYDDDADDDDDDTDENYYINQEGIKDLKKLQILNANNNWRINDVNHLKNTLTELHCIGKCNINQNGIAQLTRLQILQASSSKINDVNHLKDTLVKLGCEFYCNINQEGISKLTKLQILNADGNKNVRSVNHLKRTLIKLSCQNTQYDSFTWCDSGINQEGISELMILQELIANCNPKITNVNHLQNTLIHLECKCFQDDGDSGIDQEGISELKKLKKLYACGNKKITNIDHLKETLVDYY